MAGSFARSVATTNGYSGAIAHVRASIAAINAAPGMTGALTEVEYGSGATWWYTLIRLRGQFGAGPLAGKNLAVFIGAASSGTDCAGYTVAGAGVYCTIADESTWDAANKRFTTGTLGSTLLPATGFQGATARELTVFAFSGDPDRDLPGWICVHQASLYSGVGAGAWRTQSPARTAPVWMAGGVWTQADSGIGKTDGTGARILDAAGTAWVNASIRPVFGGATAATNASIDVDSGKRVRVYCTPNAPASTPGIYAGWIPGLVQCWDATGAPDGWPPHWWCNGAGFAWQVAESEEIE